MTRWLVLSLGLGIAAVAGYALLTRSPIPSAPAEPADDDIVRRELLRLDPHLGRL